VRILFDNATDNLSTAFVEMGLAASGTRPNRHTHQPLQRTRAAALGTLSVSDAWTSRSDIASPVLEAIYEADFFGFSYGFRPGRGQHDVLDALHAGIMRKRVDWVLDADIQGFFGASG
jgi:RNA-directed DNA polymerase